MGKRRAGDGAARAGDDSGRSFLWRRHLVSTARVGVFFFACVELITGTAAYVSTRVHDHIGVPLPVIDPVVPLGLSGFLGLLGLGCYGVVMRPRRLVADNSPRSVTAPRGGARWPGIAPAGVDGGTGSAGRVTT